jgi:hypothetical protein
MQPLRTINHDVALGDGRVLRQTWELRSAATVPRRAVLAAFIIGLVLICIKPLIGVGLMGLAVGTASLWLSLTRSVFPITKLIREEILVLSNPAVDSDEQLDRTKESGLLTHEL